MSACIFCKIVKGEIPSYKIYEDDSVYAFLDVGPINDGHTLVIPKKHSRNALEMEASEFAILSSRVHDLANSVKEGMDADGINIVFNSEHAAGQEVFHTHAHIVPRFLDDGYHWWGSGKYEEGRAEEVTEKIREKLS